MVLPEPLMVRAFVLILIALLKLTPAVLLLVRVAELLTVAAPVVKVRELVPEIVELAFKFNTLTLLMLEPLKLARLPPLKVNVPVVGNAEVRESTPAVRIVPPV